MAIPSGVEGILVVPLTFSVKLFSSPGAMSTGTFAILIVMDSNGTKIDTTTIYNCVEMSRGLKL